MAKKKHNFKLEDKYKYSTLVCVTDQMRCAALIEAGRTLADKTNTNLYVFNVSKMTSGGDATDFEALEHLFAVSKEHNAVMNVFYGMDTLEVLKRSVNEFDAVNVVTGMPEAKNSLLIDFWEQLPETNFYMVDGNGDLTKVGKTLRNGAGTR